MTAEAVVAEYLAHIDRLTAAIARVEALADEFDRLGQGMSSADIRDALDLHRKPKDCTANRGN